jgi:hypothetical protein
MKTIAIRIYALALLLAGGVTHAAPTFYIQSAVANPDQRFASISVSANAEAQIRDFGTMIFQATPASEGAPNAFQSPGGVLFEVWREPFAGPGVIGDMHLPLPDTEIPDNSVYRLSIVFQNGPHDASGDLVPAQVREGWLIMRRKPFLTGDLSDNGKVDIQDVGLSLRLTVGLVSPSPYDSAAGDLNGDGRLTLADTVSLLRRVVGGL